MTYKLDKDFRAGDFREDSARAGFGEGLVAAARDNPKIVALAADLKDSVGFGEFAKTFPERFVELGIAEQNLVAVASGMASQKNIPFAASYAAFSPGRNWEQIRTTICLNNQNVKIVGTHAGVNVGADGATHQMLEDIALMRVLPNMVVICPGDFNEAARVAKVVAQDSRPTYVRLPREKSPIFSVADAEFEIGRAYVLREGTDVTLLGTGTMTAQNLLAAEMLARENISAEVVHVPTVKPLDADTILNSIAKTRMARTVEEHQIAGGFGSVIAELISENSLKINEISRTKFDRKIDKSVLFRRLGLRDEFGQSGAAVELLDFYGLTAEKIAYSVKRAFFKNLKQSGGGLAAEANVTYVAYGADRDPDMMRHICGGEVVALENGDDVFIENYEMCIQTIDDVPELRWNGAEYSSKKNLRAAWGEDYDTFETYNIRPKVGAKVAAKLYKLTEIQHERVRDWENWFKPVLVKVRTADGRILTARTEALWEDQTASRVVDGENYPTYLLDKAKIWRVADLSRGE